MALQNYLVSSVPLNFRSLQNIFSVIGPFLVTPSTPLQAQVLGSPPLHRLGHPAVKVISSKALAPASTLQHLPCLTSADSWSAPAAQKPQFLLVSGEVVWGHCQSWPHCSGQPQRGTGTGISAGVCDKCWPHTGSPEVCPDPAAPGLSTGVRH